MNKWLSASIAMVLATTTGCLQLDDVVCVSGNDCELGQICQAGACIVDDRADTGGDGDVIGSTDGGDAGDVNVPDDATDVTDAGDGTGADADADTSSDADADTDADTDGSGGCDVTNACGGCATLDEEIGEVCGQCDLDQFICDGEDAAVCSGNTACDEVALITLEAFDVTTESFSIRAAVSITDEVVITDHGVCIDNEPSPSLDFDNCVQLGAISATTTFTGEFDELDPASLYFARAFVETETGVQYGNELQVGTAPTAPVEVSATAGDFDESVLVTWAPVDGADEYILYRDDVELITLTETSFDDTTAGPGSPPAITPESVFATQGELEGATEITWGAATALSGTQHNYVVTAVFLEQESEPSATAVGFRAGPEAAAYEVSVDGGDYMNVGNVTSYLHESAAPGILDGGLALATDGTSATLVSLTVVDYGHTPQIVEYSVRPVTFNDMPGPGVSVDGFAGIGELAIEWQRRSITGGAFTTLSGVTGAVASDSPPNQDQYEYRARLSTSLLNAVSSSDVGFVDDSLPEVSTRPVENITSNSATFRLQTSTILGDIGFCYSSTNTSPVQGDTASTCEDISTTGRTLNVTGLTPGTRYFVRAYSEPLVFGSPGYGAAVTFVTIPAAPAAVTASDAEFVTFVSVKWDPVPGATSYQVYRNGAPVSTVTTPAYTDIGAPPSATPTMMGVPFTASNNTLPDFVQLSWGAPTVQPGPSANYTVIAINESGASGQSPPDPGSRGASPITAYEVELPTTAGGTEWRNVGPELTWNDETAEPGLVRPKEVDASDGVYEQWVRLSAQSADRQPGPSRNYRVRALIGTAPGAPSSQVTGARGTGAPTYQWQRRASAGFWENITGAVGLNATDPNGAITPATTDYRVVVSAQGTASVSSDSDEGSRAVQLTIDELHAGDAFTCALYGDGSIRCWGLNTNGQAAVPGQNAVGDAFSDFPIEALDLGGDAKALAVGDQHACAIVKGNVLCWGNGADGRLGNGSTSSVGFTSGSMPPTPVPLPDDAVAIELGADYSCALLKDQKIYCWGDNTEGQLGVASLGDIGDDIRDTYLPVAVLGGRFGSVPVTLLAQSIHVGPSTACAITSDGDVVCWGNKDSGIVCTGSNRDSAAPQLLTWSATDIEIGENSMCRVNSLGAVGCCGSSTVGQGGTGTTAGWGSSSTQTTPRGVTLDGRARGLSGGRFHYCAQFESGVACWGRAASGALGNGSTTENIGDQSTDLPIPTLSHWTGIRMVEAGGQHTCLVSGTNTLSCFGEGSFGRLGNASSNDIGDAPGEMPPAPSVIR